VSARERRITEPWASSRYVIQLEDGYALSDGHHRVSGARARGAVSIDARVDGALPRWHDS
jgi:hypothetical protein